MLEFVKCFYKESKSKKKSLFFWGGGGGSRAKVSEFLLLRIQI